MPLGKEVGFGPGHIVLDGDPVGTHAAPHSSASPLSTHACCGQTVSHLNNCCALVTLYREISLPETPLTPTVECRSQYVTF